jgi:hypothetical protein
VRQLDWPHSYFLFISKVPSETYFLLNILLQEPIRKGVVSHTLMVEELGRQKVNNGVVAQPLFINFIHYDLSTTCSYFKPDMNSSNWFHCFSGFLLTHGCCFVLFRSVVFSYCSK